MHEVKAPSSGSILEALPNLLNTAGGTLLPDVMPLLTTVYLIVRTLQNVIM